MIEKKNDKSVIFSFAIILGLFLPHNIFVFQIIHAILPLFLYFIFYKKNKAVKRNKINITIILVMVLSFIVNAFLGNEVQLKDASRLISLLLLFALFPFVSNAKVTNFVLYFSVLLIFMSQIAYVLNIGFLVRLFDSVYPYTGEVRGFTTEFLLDSSNDINMITARRYGGLFHNPNQAVRFVSLLLGVFYIENRKSGFLKILPFILIVVSSIILSGSRTGLLVGGILTAAYFLFMKKQKTKMSGAIYLSAFIAIIFYLIGFVFANNELRLFDIGGGIEGSFGTKFRWFYKFFEQLDSPSKFLLGHFTTSNVRELYGIPLLDSEWGELFYSFGILGFSVFTIFYIKLWKTKDSNIRFFLLLLMWGLTSTVIFSFRMSFLFMLFLSKYYSDYLDRKKIPQ